MDAEVVNENALKPRTSEASLYLDNLLAVFLRYDHCIIEPSELGRTPSPYTKPFTQRLAHTLATSLYF